MKYIWSLGLGLLLAVAPASAQSPAPQKAKQCQQSYVRCEDWCKHWRAGVLDSCKDTHPHSCKVRFGSEGNNGYDHCLQDTPKTQ